MVDYLSSQLRKLRLSSDNLDTASFDVRLIEEQDGIIDSSRSRKKIRRHNEEDLKKELEDEFLTPSPRFSPDWLNRLQKYVFFSSTPGNTYMKLIIRLGDGTCLSTIKTFSK